MKRFARRRRRDKAGDPDRGSRGGRSPDAGDTLIEIIVAVAIIGISATGILGGLAAALGGSGTHRSLTTLDAIIKSFVETAKYDIQQRSIGQGGPMFAACASPSDYVVTSGPYPSSGPVNTLVTVFGSGFPDGTIAVTLIGPNGSTPAPSNHNPIINGDLNLSFSIPALPAGPETIQIKDTIGSNTVTSVASTPFRVTPLIQLNHASGPAGTSVNATLTGFGPNRSVNMTFGAT